jgi:hypothetical protein
MKWLKNLEIECDRVFYYVRMYSRHNEGPSALFRHWPRTCHHSCNYQPKGDLDFGFRFSLNDTKYVCKTVFVIILFRTDSSATIICIKEIKVLLPTKMIISFERALLTDTVMQLTRVFRMHGRNA